MADTKSYIGVSQCSRRGRQLRKRLAALLAEPETLLLMRADNVDTNDLMALLVKTAEDLNGSAHRKRRPHSKSTSPLLSFLYALRQCLDKTDG